MSVPGFNYNKPYREGPLPTLALLAVVAGLGTVAVSNLHDHARDNAAVEMGLITRPAEVTKDDPKKPIGSLQAPRYDAKAHARKTYGPPKAEKVEVTTANIEELHQAEPNKNPPLFLTEPKADQPVIIGVPRVATIQEAFPGYKPAKKY